MATAISTAPADSADEAPTKGGRRKMIVLAVPVVLVAVGAGLWFSGVLPSLLSLGGKKTISEETHPAKPSGEGQSLASALGHDSKTVEGKATGPETAGGAARFVELPDIVANLNAGNRRTVYIKLKARIEMARPEDAPALRAAMPRLQDLFQTYLREMRPEELRGSAGTYRLREELIARADIAVAPARIQDLLFTEILVQ
jgi:flagellar FliL protein